MNVDLHKALQVAENAAQLADQEIRRYWQMDNVHTRRKQDDSPVTDADLAAERVIRQQILDAFPDHAIYGEEFGRSGADDAPLWLIDPIDGTQCFIRGQPFFSTQIALMVDEDIVLGVSHAPVFKETYSAIRGEGARHNGKPLHVAGTETLSRTTLSTGNIKTLAKSPQWKNFAVLLAKVERTRGYGDYFHYHELARGGIDIVLESDLNILDIAALACIVTEAGGVMTDLQGQPIGLDTRSVLAANPILHVSAMETLYA